MKGKRASDGKYWLVASMILGLIVASIIIFFVFNVYFTSEDIDFEVCRESVILRANAPDVKKGGLSFASLKEQFPLKCKTKVVEITKQDVENKQTGTIIGDTMAECWALYENGDKNLFPSNVFGLDSYCIPCARIHLTPEAKTALKTDIDIDKILRTEFFKQVPYYNYLNQVGGFPALNFGGARAFDTKGERFKIEEDDAEVTLKNSRTGKTEEIDGLSNVILPKTWKLNGEDLLIVYGTVDSSANEGVGDYIPYLLYFQADETSFAETRKDLIDATTIWSPFQSLSNKLEIFDHLEAKVCDYWEGIPA